MIDKIRTETQYSQIMQLIDSYLQKATQGGGFHSLSKAETKELQHLSQLAEEYEDRELKIFPLTVTINTVVTEKMKELDITQKGLAEVLGIDPPKLSQILSNKRPPDVTFLKAIHQKLGIDGNFILDRV